MVEETLEDGASVARVALKHGVNANQVFQWRRLYRDGKLGAPAEPAMQFTASQRRRRPGDPRSLSLAKWFPSGAERFTSSCRARSGSAWKAGLIRPSCAQC